MNCQKFRQLHDDGEALAATDSLAEAWSRHARRCAGCQAWLAVDDQLREMLASHPVPAPGPAFAARIERAMAPAGGDRVRPGWSFGAGFATAAGLLLGLWLLLGGQPRESAGLMQLVVGQPKTVQLVFSVPEDLPGSTMTLHLPPGVELNGYPGQRALSWPVDLARGRNGLSLPIVARSARDGVLEARIAHGDGEQVFKVRIQARPGAAEEAADARRVSRV